MTDALVLGDTHGNTKVVLRHLQIAADRGIPIVIQVGDFGFWDHIPQGQFFLNDVSGKAQEVGVDLLALGGNHENWDGWNLYLGTHQPSKYGGAEIQSNLHLLPRTHYLELAGKRLGFVCGGYSIDKASRLIYQASGSPKSWWPQEEITDAEVDEFSPGKLDYLFTHDCSDKTPFDNGLLPILESKIHRQRIDRVLEKTRPQVHFHGHMHRQYLWSNYLPDGHAVYTVGLSADGSPGSAAIIGLESGDIEILVP